MDALAAESGAFDREGEESFADDLVGATEGVGDGEFGDGLEQAGVVDGLDDDVCDAWVIEEVVEGRGVCDCAIP